MLSKHGHKPTELPSPGETPASPTPPSPGETPASPTPPSPGETPASPTPPVFLRKLRRAAVAVGCDIRLRVTVGGHPRPSLHWYHNDTAVAADAQDYGGLWIRDCHQTDSGMYTCVAINSLGEAMTSGTLAVLDLGEDSDNTDDENGESQVSMETKERSRALQAQAAGNQMPGGGKARVAHLPVPCDGPVVEREIQALGSRAPGLQDPLHPGRSHLGCFTGGESPVVCTQPSQNAQSPVAPLILISAVGSPAALNGSQKLKEEVELSGKAKSARSSILPPSSQDPALLPSLKLPRTGSKILDKVRAFEQRKDSFAAAKAVSSERPCTSISRRSSSDVEDERKRGGVGARSSESDAGLRRAVFKQRASSLEDRTTYTQKVHSFQNQFTEELQRIKKLVGRPNIKKAFSTEHLPPADKQPIVKVEPLPPKVIARVTNENKGSSAEVFHELPVKELSQQTEAELVSEVPGAGSRLRTASQAQPPDGPECPVVKDSQPSQLLKENVPETSERRSPRLARKTVGRGRAALPAEPLPSSPSEQPKKEPRRSGPKSEDEAIRAPPKPPRLLATASTFPRMREGRGERVTPSRLPPLTIPAILVEDESVQDSERSPGRRYQSTPQQKGQKQSRGGSDVGQTTAREEEEIPAGSPVFSVPLRDVVAAAGSEVILECVVAGNTSQVTWKKGDMILREGAGYEMTAEGGRHALRISPMRPSDAGTYSVTIGDGYRASCRATVFIQSEPVGVQSGPLTSTPTLPDNEFLSTVEEGMDFEVGSRTDVPSVKEPPTFQVALRDMAVREGEDVTMCVKMRGRPKPVICWLKDRVNLRTDGHHELCEMGNGRCELRIKSAGKVDAGIYTCKIINEHGTELTDCRLEVKDRPPPELLSIIRPAQDVRVCAGHTALFECLVSGPEDADVDWLAKGKLIQPALLDCKMQRDGRRCRLQLRSVHEDDSGRYTCKVSNSKEEVISSAQLTVTPSKEPLFTRKLEALEVTEGRSAHFDCKVSGTPPPEVTWTHYDQPLVESENIHILKEGGRHSLHLSRVTRETEGLYTARARNPHGWTESSAHLCVQEPRTVISPQTSRLEKMPSIPEEPEGLEGDLDRRTMPDFQKPLSDLEVLEGREAVLMCKVTGTPYPTITWYHNGQKINSTDDRKMMQYRDVHSLVIRSVHHSHNGVYKSVISNKVGQATCYAHLYVTDILPEPPDGPPVVESITGRTITISWKRPKNLDSSIDPSCLMYVVQQQVLGSIQWPVVASGLRETSYTVTALSKGVRYAFRVLSTTGRAFSKPSPPTEPILLIDRGQYLQKGPVILEKPDTVHVVENQPVTIMITLNHVQASVTWKRRGAALAYKPGVYEMFMPDDDRHALKICKVKGADIGQLICTANNQYGSDLCTVLLAVAAPPAFETIMEDLDACIGETARFAVVVDAKPDPDILWYKDSMQLAESCHIAFVYEERECSLVISGAQPADSGVYTCIAKNLAGEVSCKAELIVHTEKKVEAEEEEELDDKGAVLRRMRRLTDYYDVHKEIGRGAFSYVKRVTQKSGKLEYAAKFISTRVKKKTSALREMELLSEVDHERILYFHDAFEKKNVVVIITELCQEELLERLIKKTTVQESEIRFWIMQVLEGIAYLHQNDIIHLDIKPENILMADRRSDHIKICDFGNARKFTSHEAQYCTYGAPEYIGPEIVNQTPISTATDIWPVGVITYLCLTGVSPFAGESDRDTLLNIRSSNVAFEESMFAECREAKGFVIKLLVTDRLRPDVTECLRHPWFKTLTKGKTINTSLHKQVLARTKWHRSLISYKSKMVMRSIPELLDDSSKHVSLAVPRSLTAGSPLASSSSDSDEDIDELPFVPMPLTMMFSGSRMSLTEIQEDDGVAVGASGSPHRNLHEGAGAVHCELFEGEDGTEDRAETTDDTGPTEQAVQNGSSTEAEEAATKPRRRLMRRGSSADSALLLHITPDEHAASCEPSEEGQKSMKKAMSMDLPQRSSSPGLSKLSQEDYALKLELLRQRLLRGGSGDKKMSGLRGPLFETLGMGNEKRTLLDCNVRTARLGSLAHGTSAHSPGESPPKTKASLSQGEPETTSLRRRSGAPLEIPSAKADRCKKTPVSAVPQEVKLEAQPELPRAHSDGASTPDLGHQETTGEEGRSSMHQDEPFSSHLLQHNMKKVDSKEELRSPLQRSESRQRPECILAHNIPSTDSNIVQPCAKYDSSVKPIPTSKISEQETSSEHPAVFANMSFPTPVHQPTLRTDIKDIDSEEVFEARFKKRESSLTRGLKRLTKSRVEGKSPVLPRKTGEEVYRPGPTGAPLEFVSRGLQEKSKSFQDLREVDKEPGLGLIGRLSLRMKKSDGKEEKPKEENSSSSRRKVTWALGRSKSLDKKAPESEVKDKHSERDRPEGEYKKVSDSPVLAMRRKFESKVSGISDRIRSKSQERKNSTEVEPVRSTELSNDEEKRDMKKVSDSPILAMCKKFDSKFSDSSITRSHSEERGVEAKTTPLLSRHRHTQSESIGLKKLAIPENQLPSQTACTASKESLDSTSSAQSIKSSQTPERDRRSRWDRWGLSRGKRDRTPSKSSGSSTPLEDNHSAQQYTRSASDFPPVFHIKLKDHILLEGDPITLICLPAGSPHPNTVWMKDKKPIELDDRMNLMASPDGRHLLMIIKTGQKDSGLYECVATNNLGSATTSCSLTLASVPKRPGTPEIPQVYNNTALVVWKPADNKSPCTYTLERRSEGDHNWLVVAAGISDCYYNVTELPRTMSLRFRVACVNKAGQGPYSSVSERVDISHFSAATHPHPAGAQTPPSVSSPPHANTAAGAPELPAEHSPSAQASVLMSGPASQEPLQTRATTAPWRKTTVNAARAPPFSTSDPQTVSSPHSPAHISPVSVDTKAGPNVTLTSGPVAAVVQLPPKARSVPPLVPAKPNSPVNVVPPIAQVQSMSQRSCTAPPSVGQPISIVPNYVPAPHAQTAPTPVIITNSISPVGDGAASPGSETPTGRVFPSTKSETVLRQGVPQKPYTFLDERARGRFGVIRDCRENATGKMFMAKIVCFDQETKQTVMREYEILKALHSEKIMALHEAYVTPRYLVLITECCMGKEVLYSLIDRYRYSEDDVAGYVVQILQGLDYLHNCRILHLDIKPENIMLTSANVIKIIDFGSAQSFNPFSLQHYSRDLGTLEYMAPEMLKADAVGPPADVWGLGILTYIMLSGRLPFHDNDPQQTEAKIQAAKLDSTKLHPNVSQSALSFLQKTLNGYSWSRPTAKDCLTHSWLQDTYLGKLRRQTLTFTPARLKEFLGEQQRLRVESATRHKVLLRTYHGGPQSPASPSGPPPPSKPASQ